MPQKSWNTGHESTSSRCTGKQMFSKALKGVVANRLQDLSLLSNTHLIYSNRIATSIHTSPSALFIHPNSQLHAAQQCAPSHWMFSAFPEAAFTFSGSQILQENLALPEPCQVYNIQQVRDAPQVENPGGFCRGLLVKQSPSPKLPKARGTKIRAQG